MGKQLTRDILVDPPPLECHDVVLFERPLNLKKDQIVEFFKLFYKNLPQENQFLFFP